MASVEHLRQQGAQQNVPQSAGAQPGNQSENDPIYRFKLLLPRLKESLVVSFLNVQIIQSFMGTQYNNIGM